jgi:hypothetical protein
MKNESAKIQAISKLTGGLAVLATVDLSFSLMQPGGGEWNREVGLLFVLAF